MNIKIIIFPFISNWKNTILGCTCSRTKNEAGQISNIISTAVSWYNSFTFLLAKSGPIEWIWCYPSHSYCVLTILRIFPLLEPAQPWSFRCLVYLFPGVYVHSQNWPNFMIFEGVGHFEPSQTEKSIGVSFVPPELLVTNSHRNV